MKTLRECLSEYDTAQLGAIAERRGIELRTSLHDEMIDEMTAALLDPAAIAETLAWLTAQERRALDTLILNGGQLPLLRFRQQFGEIRRFGPGSLAREAPWRAPVSPAESLWYQGLIARRFTNRAGVLAEFAFIPSDLLLLLPPPQIADTPFDAPVADTPHRVQDGDPALIDDLCMLLALVQNQDVQTRDGQLGAETIAHLHRQFLVAHPERTAFLYHLGQAAGLIHLEGRRLRLRRDPVRAWLKQSRSEQLERLQHTWRDDVAWNDLWQMPGIVCEDSGWSNDPFLARQTISNFLSRCAGDAWLSIDGLIDIIYQQAPDYLRPDGDFASWYIRDARTNQYLTGFEHWDKIEGALIAYLIGGPLHWLGVVSLGFKEGWSKPSAFRLTPWGRSFLGRGERAPERPQRPASITPQGQITLPRTASLFDRFQLARIAEWRASGADYVFEITAEALRRAFGTNIQAEMVENFVTRLCQGQTPAAAIARIRNWANRYGQVRLRRVIILETRTQKTMLDLQAHDRIRGYLRQLLSPTQALIRERDWEIVIRELERAGYLPEIVEH